MGKFKTELNKASTRVKFFVRRALLDIQIATILMRKAVTWQQNASTINLILQSDQKKVC